MFHIWVSGNIAAIKKLCNSSFKKGCLSIAKDMIKSFNILNAIVMQITFLPNFLNHYQASLGDEIYKQLNGNFTFVSTGRIPA